MRLPRDRAYRSTCAEVPKHESVPQRRFSGSGLRMPHARRRIAFQSSAINACFFLRLPTLDLAFRGKRLFARDEFLRPTQADRTPRACVAARSAGLVLRDAHGEVGRVTYVVGIVGAMQHVGVKCHAWRYRLTLRLQLQPWSSRSPRLLFATPKPFALTFPLRAVRLPFDTSGQAFDSSGERFKM